jgi:hypothetical protein
MLGQHQVGQFRLGAAEIGALALLRSANAVAQRIITSTTSSVAANRRAESLRSRRAHHCPARRGWSAGIPVRGLRLIQMPTDNSEAMLSRGPKSVPIQTPIGALREAHERISPWVGGQNQAEKPIDLIDVCHKLRSCGHIWPRNRSRTGCPSTRFRFHLPPRELTQLLD